ncbi:MAG TPA: methyl-accepting chemotaxis protein [Clostridiales bacterium]|nr:methyl-accepting chemotaxis protein [Clostridiales bacterium]
MNNDKSKITSIRLGLDKIRYKLIGSFLVPVVLILLLGIICYLEASAGIADKYESAAQTSMTMTAKYFDTVLAAIESKAMQLDTDSIVSRYFSGNYEYDSIEQKKRMEEIVSKMLSITLSDKSISHIYIFSKDGYGLSSDGKMLNHLYEEFTISEDMDKIGDHEAIWLGTHSDMDHLTGQTSDQYCISYIRKLHNQSNDPIGFIVVDVKYNFIKSALDSIALEKNSFLGFVTNDKREITVDWSETEKQTELQFSLQSFYNSDGEEKSEYVSVNKKAYMYLESKVESAGVTICALIPKTVILEQSSGMKRITVIFVLIASVIAITIGSVMAGGIGGTIHKINKVLERVTEGELNSSLTTKRRDEFKVLTDSINGMIKGMRELVAKMAQVSGDVNNSSQNVVMSSETLLHASDKIDSASNDIRAGMEQQAQDTQECLVKMEGLAVQIQLVKDHIDKIEKSARHSVDISQKGLDTTKQLKAKSDTTNMITGDIVTDMRELDEKSESITQFVKIINDISAQTNLLSLNASIEAARAGAAGKGFSVVASEIGKLAEESEHAAGQIIKVVNSIRNQSTKTLDTALRAEEVVKEQDILLTETLSVFNIIAQSIHILLTDLKQITLSIDRMDDSKNETLAAIENISAAAQETAANTIGLADIIGQQVQVAEILKEAVNNLNSNAVDLNNTVQIFRIS